MPFVTLTAGPPSVMADAVDVRDRQASPSTSLSLPRTSTEIEPSSATVKLSFDATGASLTGVTVPDDRRHGRDRAVRDRVRERRRAVVVGRRCEHELARHQMRPCRWSRDRRTTVRDGRAVDVGDRQTVAVDVAVVAENVDRDRSVFGDREAVIRCDRRVVDRRDRAVDRRHRRDRAVRDRVRERGRAVVVGRRCEHELARHESHRAVRDADRRTTVRDRLRR